MSRTAPAQDRRRTPFGAAALLAALVPALLWQVPSAAATEGDARLEEIEKAAAADREKAEALKAKAAKFQEEIRAMRGQAIEVAKKTQDLEEELSAIEVTLATFRLEERHKVEALRGQQGRLYTTLGALQRIAVRPPEALLLSPGSPITTVRSAMLLRVAVPVIEGQAGTIRSELHELQTLRESIALQQGALAETVASLESERRQLDGLIARKSELITEADAAAKAARKRAERLAGEAKDLRDLIAKLEQEAKERAEREKQERLERQRKLEAEAEARRQALAEAEAEARRQAEAVAIAEAEAAAKAQAEAEAAAKARAEAETAAKAEAEAKMQAEAKARAEAREKEIQEARDRAAAAERQATEAAEAARVAEQASRQQEAARTTLQDMVNLAKPNNVRAFPDSPSIASLMMPARGDILSRYGQQRRSDGTSSKGITIGTRSGAQVVAPFDGRVAYAGQFRGYGQILIIEHGGRYHTLLAGMDRVDAVVGQWLLAGEPVGVMAKAHDFRPELYLELRRTGQPINPLPWLATNSEKVQG